MYHAEGHVEGVSSNLGLFIIGCPLMHKNTVYLSYDDDNSHLPISGKGQKFGYYCVEQISRLNVKSKM